MKSRGGAARVLLANSVMKNTVMPTSSWPRKTKCRARRQRRLLTAKGEGVKSLKKEQTGTERPTRRERNGLSNIFFWYRPEKKDFEGRKVLPKDVRGNFSERSNWVNANFAKRSTRSALKSQAVRVNPPTTVKQGPNITVCIHKIR